MTQLRMGLRWGLGLLVAVGLLGMAGGARGQSLDSGSVGQAAESRTYGAVAKTFLALTPWGFHLAASTTTYALNSSAIGQTKIRTGGAQLFKAPVHLPAGALVTEVAIVFCDTSSTTGFGPSFFTQPRMAFASLVVLAVSTNAEAPGCVDTTVTFTTPVQIDNNANSYHIEIVMGAADATIQFASARVGYVLQVSPAPAVATFSDVPKQPPVLPLHRSPRALRDHERLRRRQLLPRRPADPRADSRLPVARAWAALRAVRLRGVLKARRTAP